MKKLLVIAMCAALVATFTACNSSSDSSSESASEEKEEAVEEEPEEAEETVEPEEADAEEALDEQMDEEEPKEDAATTEDAEGEYITTTYEGMTFSYPSDCGYEEGDGYVVITLEESKEILEIVAYGEHEQEEDSSISIGTWLEVDITGFLSNFDSVSNESSQDMTLAGCEAKEITALATLDSNIVNFSGIAVYSNQHNIYGIYYTCTYGADGRLADYEAFLDSISFE